MFCFVARSARRSVVVIEWICVCVTRATHAATQRNVTQHVGRQRERDDKTGAGELKKGDVHVADIGWQTHLNVYVRRRCLSHQLV